MSTYEQTQQSKKLSSISQKQGLSASSAHVSHPASIIQRARIDPKSLTAADVLQLQRTIGNRAVGRLLSEIRNPSKVQQVPIQRQEIPEEKEPLQGKFEIIQRLEPEDEEKLQMKSVVQRQEIPEEDEPLQGKMADPIQRQEIPEEEEPLQGKMIGTVQRQEIPEEEEPLQKKSENNTGMPDNLKAGVESLSGIDMSDVRVHYNSSKPSEVGALAYTQGTNIHVAPGQERHLPHEAWHVVQQKQDRVKPTLQMKDMAVNDDVGLELEADMMGGKATFSKKTTHLLTNSPIQRTRLGREDRDDIKVEDIQPREQITTVKGHDRTGDYQKVSSFTVGGQTFVDQKLKHYMVVRNGWVFQIPIKHLNIPSSSGQPGGGWLPNKGKTDSTRGYQPEPFGGTVDYDQRYEGQTPLIASRDDTLKREYMEESGGISPLVLPHDSPLEISSSRKFGSSFGVGTLSIVKTSQQLTGTLIETNQKRKRGEAEMAGTVTIDCADLINRTEIGDDLEALIASKITFARNQFIIQVLNAERLLSSLKDPFEKNAGILAHLVGMMAQEIIQERQRQRTVKYRIPKPQALTSRDLDVLYPGKKFGIWGVSESK